MTIHRIRLLGDPILRTRCEPITRPGSTAVRVIMDDMRETLRDWQSRFGAGRGISAPQIGAPVVEGASVTATIESQYRGEKIVVFKVAPAMGGMAH